MRHERPTDPAFPEAIRAARERLDAWVRELAEWHFGPETGCPFWLERARRLSWDPRREIRGYRDLARLGPFPPEWLRGGPLSRWVPHGLAGRPVYVFERTGAAGALEHRIACDDFRADWGRFSETLPDGGFPRGADWLSLAPTGPRCLRLAMEHLAQHRGGICFLLDLDPRYVARCRERGRSDMVEAYQAHVISQALTVLRAHDGIRCLFTTPEYLAALCEKVSLRRLGVRGVLCEGNGLGSELHHRLRAELLGGVSFVPAWANMLIGLAPSRPFFADEGYEVTYHALEPHAVLEVVDPESPERCVPYGARGRVKVTVLTRELFLPGLLEPQEAVRAPACRLYPWDGIREVRPLPERVAVGVEGGY